MKVTFFTLRERPGFLVPEKKMLIRIFVALPKRGAGPSVRAVLGVGLRPLAC
jgi:hypothetical protein